MNKAMAQLKLLSVDSEQDMEEDEKEFDNAMDREDDSKEETSMLSTAAIPQAYRQK